MRTMEIRGGVFKVKQDESDIGTVYKAVKCAFNENRVCGVSCAACDVFGSYDDKAECRRGGDDNSFRIGNIKVKV